MEYLARVIADNELLRQREPGTQGEGRRDDHPAEADKAVAALQPIDLSLTSPDAIVDAAGRVEVKQVLRGILTPRHPSQLYEAFFEGIVLFSILWFVRTRLRTPNGVLIGLFFICYAIFRIIVEYFREPDASLIAGFTRGQFFSFFLIAIGVGFIVAAKRQPTYPKHQAPTSKLQRDSKSQ